MRGSGTRESDGLRGTCGFRANLAEGAQVHLGYRFEQPADQSPSAGGRHAGQFTWIGETSMTTVRPLPFVFADQTGLKNGNCSAPEWDTILSITARRGRVSRLSAHCARSRSGRRWLDDEFPGAGHFGTTK